MKIMEENEIKCEFSELLLLSGISQEEINKLAIDLGLVKRNSLKFDPTVFLAVVCLRSQVGSPSYNDLAAEIETNYGVSLSKQALWKRVNDSCVIFFQTILSMIIQKRATQHEIKNISIGNKFSRIIIQDSTVIKVPKRLYDIFSGVSNAHSTVCNVRIQGVYELISGRFIDFSIDPFSKNDVTSAPELQFCKSDLVLRDRGYSTYSEIERHVSVKADCIYRHKTKSIYLDIETYTPIDLKKLLRKNNNIDMIVSLNNKEKTKVRLLAVPVSEKIANNRRRNAKKGTRSHNPSKELLESMGYTIYITTIMDKEIEFKQIQKFYSLRWKIEIIFKIWKSHMSFDEIHNVSNNQLSVLLVARLIMIVLNTHLMYVPYYTIVKEFRNRDLSMMKFLKYIVNNPKVISILVEALNETIFKNQSIIDNLTRYCTYDKRKMHSMSDIENQVLLS
jgi:DNA-dependent RNA polymerase auxiliary subunit epsilon